jgi:galactokinase
MLFPVESPPEFSSFEDEFATRIAACDFFAADGNPIWIARAPGRLDVMGGNVDYTGGMVLQSLLREAIHVAVQLRTDDTIRILNPDAAQFGWESSFELRVADLGRLEDLRLLCNQRETSRWGGYVLGALHLLRQSRWDTGGADIFIASDLPPNKGVSSSAALVVAVLKAASAAYGISLDGIALATAGQWVENVVVGAACGIMDQAAIVLGTDNHLLPLLCQPCRPFPAIKLSTDLCIWGIDSMESRSTRSEAYEIARAAAFIGYKLICLREGIDVVPEIVSGIPRFTDLCWNGYLSNLAPSEFRSSYERWLPESLSGRECLARIGIHADPFTTIHHDWNYPVRAAVRYATEENLRVQTVRTLLESSAQSVSDDTVKLIGEVLCQSHHAYAECGLRSEACDALVARALKVGFAGAKMTGGGAGGVVALFGRPEDKGAVHRIAEEYAAERGRMPHLFQGSSSGVDAAGVRELQPRCLQDQR